MTESVGNNENLNDFGTVGFKKKRELSEKVLSDFIKFLYTHRHKIRSI
jgi:hypothetical protein